MRVESFYIWGREGGSTQIDFIFYILNLREGGREGERQGGSTQIDFIKQGRVWFAAATFRSTNFVIS